MNRTDRLVGFLTILQSRKFVPLETFVQTFNISERTVYRDLKALDEIGVPIGHQPNYGYFVTSGYFLPPVSFSSDEAQSLILIASLVAKYGDTTTRSNVRSAISKIMAVLQENDKDSAGFLDKNIRIYLPEKHSDPGFLTPIRKAISEKQILTITYTDNSGKSSERDVEPIGLSFYSDQWHVIAWCWKREGYRDFKVNAISVLKLNGAGFLKEDHMTLDDYIRSLQND